MNRIRQSALSNCATLAILIVASACGGGGGQGQPPPGPVSTLAYVVTECRQDAAASLGTIRQRLQIRRGDQAPSTIVEHSAVGFTGVAGLCASVGVERRASVFIDWGVFHRLGVTPDGSQVVFEVTDDDERTVFPPNTLPPEQKGIFAVRADGTGLPRPLGPASRQPLRTNADGTLLTSFVFSPNGRTIAYTDRGPSRDNQDAVQVFTLDLATGDRRQLTRLPPEGPSAPYATCCPFFNDDQTITLLTYANADGRNPDGENISVTVKTTDGSLTVAPPVLAIPGSPLVPNFIITGSEVGAVLLRLPGTPEGAMDYNYRPVQELFVIDGRNNLLQLTNFHREDTFNPNLSADGQRVFFSAGADPLGTNPTENCQIFSIDRNGGDLRQLTDFHEGPHSRTGCHHGRPPQGCTAFFLNRDAQSDALVFYSTCDPFGTNPYGSQLFAMHPDGTGLRQLTDTQGYMRDASGAVSVELPFPFANPGQRF